MLAPSASSSWLTLPSCWSVGVFGLLFLLLRTLAILALLYRQRAEALQHPDRVRLRQRTRHGSGGLEATAVSTSSSSSSTSPSPIHTLLILGSGGHTAELLSVMDRVDRSRYAPLLFVRAATDPGSEAKARSREEARGNTAHTIHASIPRSREVGQSYVTSIWTTLVALLHAVKIVFQFKPELILCNGPGTCFPICFVAFVFKIVLFRPCSLVFIESFCRVDSLSLSGILLYPLVDEFVVQWPELSHKLSAREAERLDESTLLDKSSKEIRTHGGWKYVKYIGRLC